MSELMTVKEVADLLKVSDSWVYDNQVKLGGIKLSPKKRGAVRFFKNKIEEKLNDAISDAEREMARQKDDRRKSQNARLSNQGGGKKMGSSAKRGSVAGRSIADPYALHP